MMLQLADVTSGYSSINVVHNVSLELARGDRVALVGPNGAGKTTLLETIAGFVRISSGRIHFDGRDLSRDAPEFRARLGIALVPEKRNLFSEMSAAEHLQLGRCAVRGADRWNRQAVERARERVLSLFPKLGQIYNRPVGVMSGGEQQMVAIGRALMAEPSLLILDEPSQGLAPKIVADMYQAIDALGSDLTLLVVEQDVALARTLTDSVHLVLNGRVRRLRAEEMDDEAALASEIFGRVAS